MVAVRRYDHELIHPKPSEPGSVNLEYLAVLTAATRAPTSRPARRMQQDSSFG